MKEINCGQGSSLYHFDTLVEDSRYFQSSFSSCDIIFALNGRNVTGHTLAPHGLNVIYRTSWSEPYQDWLCKALSKKECV